MSLTRASGSCRPVDATYDDIERRGVGAVRMRSLESGDTAAVLEVFAGLGSRSRELRFLSAKPRLTAFDLDLLTSVDGTNHIAVLAVSARGGRPIGVARFVRDADDPRSADVAVAVVDAWQNRGIGTRLASALIERASAVGVRRFTLVMSRQNVAAARLLHRAPGHIEPLAIDLHTVEFALHLEGRETSQPQGLQGRPW